MTPLVYLKVPKCETFDRSDFPDFYIIKSSWVGDLVVKIKKIFSTFQGSLRGAKFLTHMLSLFIRRFFKFGPTKIFSVELLRPLVSVKMIF